jgi:two-component system chemotaxis response regulator CheB
MAVSFQRLEPVAPTRPPYRVMLVDDSIIIRIMFRRFLQEHTGIRVVATAGDGQQALRALDVTNVEVALLDLEMPVMDGLQTLPRLLTVAPDLRVITLGSPERAMAGLALSTLFQGASDLLAKPQTSAELNADGFRRELVAKVRCWGAVARGRLDQEPGWPVFRPVRHRSRQPSSPVVLRPPSVRPPKVLAVLCGEGGPRALYRLFGQLAGAPLGPVFVRQPLPFAFSSVLADHLAGIGARPCRLARDGEPVASGQIHLASAEQTVTVGRHGTGHQLRVIDDGRHRAPPAATAMLASLAEAHGEDLFLVVLSGAGSEGMEGVRAVADAGGTVIVEDRESAPVWTLPVSIAQAGLASRVLPLTKIGRHVHASFAEGG